MMTQTNSLDMLISKEQTGMAFLGDENTKVICQDFTGSQAPFRSEQADIGMTV